VFGKPNVSADLRITPHEGVGPVRLGMTRDEVRAALSGFPGALAETASHESVDHFFGSALEVEYGCNGGAMFVGASFYPGCGCTFTLDGYDPWSIPASDLFERLARLDGGVHRFQSTEYLFRSLVVTLWDAERQYDHRGHGVMLVFAQIGVGNAEYLQSVDELPN
jgi:hypothetical protein